MLLKKESSVLLKKEIDHFCFSQLQLENKNKNVDIAVRRETKKKNTIKMNKIIVNSRN